MKYTIALFAYDFPHRKTQDFILELVSSGVTDFVVFAAPKKNLKHTDDNIYFQTSLKLAPPLDPEIICKNLGLKFYSLDHDNLDEINKLVKAHQINIGIISGARIISNDVINLFENGIVNFHPGMIPETSGLDSFYYTIKQSIAMGVTTHFIDRKVDAGMHIAFDELFIGANDSPEIVQENLYQLQKLALRNLIKKILTGTLESLPINRPFKNEPLSPELKRKLILEYGNWRAIRYAAQQKSQLFEACDEGKAEVVLKILNQFPELVNSHNSSGWTPLIIACFRNNYDLVKTLLEFGADPNITGIKGTTPIMYAKTYLMNSSSQNYSILNLLLSNGADINRTDCYGKTVFDYIAGSKNTELVEYFNTLRN